MNPLSRPPTDEVAAMILLFESHPIQYRSPLYRAVTEYLHPEKFQVVYGSDFSVRSYQDREFGQDVAWGSDLLTGICHHFTPSLRRIELDGWRALGRRGVREAFDRAGFVHAVVLTSLRFEFDWAALFEARRRGIPVLLRTETQDAAFDRGWGRRIVRDFIYLLLYSQIDRCLPIGKLNAMHYARLGLSSTLQNYVRYAVPNPFEEISDSEKMARRHAWRRSLGVAEDVCLVGFVGKLISKKNPVPLLDAIGLVDSMQQSKRVEVVFVGAGPLRETLEARAASLSSPVHFVGFLNQLELPDAYLAMDLLVLPSRREGETWGLVVNEALHAGCAVAVSDAAGCHVEFAHGERVRVFPDGDCPALAKAIADLMDLPRAWNWAADLLKTYTIEASARAFARNLREYVPARGELI